MDLKNYTESRALSGYGTVLMVKEGGKYHMLVACESIPSPAGDVETFEFDLLQSPVKGKIIGKSSYEAITLSVLMHRDNIMRLDQFKGKAYDYMIVYPDYTAKKFIGTLTYNPDDAGAEKLTMGVTITPMSAQEDMTIDCRAEIEPVVVFTSSVPSEVKLVGNSKTEEITVATAPETATLSAESTATGVATVTVSGSKVTITSVANGYAIVSIKATAVGYGSWTTYVAVEVQ